MPYEKLTGRALMLQRATWYKTNTLEDFLRQASTKKFSIVANRDEVLSDFSKIPIERPFTKTDRFNGDYTYVPTVMGGWPRKMRIFLQSLSFKENDKDPLKNPNKGGSSNFQPTSGGAMEAKLWNYDDAETAYYTAIAAMLDELGSFDNVFDTERFEGEFSLNWR